MSGALTSTEQRVAFIRHELRTPLTAIQGYSEMILEEIQNRTDQTGAELARDINRAGEATLEFINAYAHCLSSAGEDGNSADQKLLLDKIVTSNQSIVEFAVALKSCGLTAESVVDLGAIAAASKNLDDMINQLSSGI